MSSFNEDDQVSLSESYIELKPDNTFKFRATNLTLPIAVFLNLKRQKRKDHFVVNAINNLFKKNNYLQLVVHLQNSLISEKKFLSEIKNEKKYVVSIDEIANEEDVLVINDIISKVNKKLDLEEVSELFSTDFSSITTKYLK
ncbi:MAG: hypothetical protein GW876_00450 [Bacteroidetes bacterium]|nr:hypothetical protein [Bacteroidota bacterium]